MAPTHSNLFLCMFAIFSSNITECRMRRFKIMVMRDRPNQPESGTSYEMSSGTPDQGSYSSETKMTKMAGGGANYGGNAAPAPSGGGYGGDQGSSGGYGGSQGSSGSYGGSSGGGGTKEQMEKIMVIMKNKMMGGGGGAKMMPMMEYEQMKMMENPMMKMMSTDSCMVPINVCEMSNAGGDNGYMMMGPGMGAGKMMMNNMYGMGMGLGMGMD